MSVRLDSIVPKARYGKQDLGFFYTIQSCLPLKKLAPLSHLSKHEQHSFRNLAETTRATLWETYSDAQDLLSEYLIPKYPANLKKS